MGSREGAGPDLAPDLKGRQDVEQREPLDATGLVEGETVADARAAVVPDHRKTHMPERLHDGDHVPAHLALGVDRMRGIAARRRGPAVAAQVHAHDRVRLSERRRDAMEASVRLREAMQEHHRRSVTAAAHENTPRVCVDPVRVEAGEEVACVGHELR
jgi:hypothetical protein